MLSYIILLQAKELNGQSKCGIRTSLLRNQWRIEVEAWHPFAASVMLVLRHPFTYFCIVLLLQKCGTGFHLFEFSLHFNEVYDIWNVWDRRWTPQCKLAITACLINILNIIWYTRNQARFHDKVIHWRSGINLIISSTSITGNNTKKNSSMDMTEFVILKALRINIHTPNALVIKEVINNQIILP